MLKFTKLGFIALGLSLFAGVHAVNPSLVTGNACATIKDFESQEFCREFADIARCHCTQSLPSRFCQNVQQIYTRMIATFGSIEKACRFQHDTSQENCIDAWKCYLEGGQLKNGQVCSGSGIPCI